MAIQLTLNANSGYGVPVKIFTRDVEEEALNQLRQVAQLQFIHSHVAVMPDSGQCDSHQKRHHSSSCGGGYWVWYECDPLEFVGESIAR